MTKRQIESSVNKALYKFPNEQTEIEEISIKRQRKGVPLNKRRIRNQYDTSDSPTYSSNYSYNRQNVQPATSRKMIKNQYDTSESETHSNNCSPNRQTTVEEVINKRQKKSRISTRR